MKNWIIGLVALAFGLSSCEKVIDIDVKDGDQKTHLYSEVLSTNHSVQLSIAKSNVFLENTDPEVITDAQVTLTTNGQSIPLVHKENGIYGASISPKHLANYNISTQINGETHEAKASISAPVSAAIVEFTSEDSSGYERFRLRYAVKDPENEINYYQLRVYKNGGLLISSRSQIVLFTDEGRNGQVINRNLNRTLFKQGDKVRIELLSISRHNYQYLQTVSDIAILDGATAPGAAAPGNPESNWSNGAVGYFMAASSSLDSAEVK